MNCTAIKLLTAAMQPLLVFSSGDFSRSPLQACHHYHHAKLSHALHSKKKFSHIGVLYRCLSDFEAQLRYFSRRSGRRYRVHPRPEIGGYFSLHFPVPIAIHRARRSFRCSRDEKKVGLMLPPWIADVVSRSFSAPAKSVSRSWDRVLFHNASLSRPATGYIAWVSEDPPKPRIIDELRALLYLVLLYGTFFAPRKPVILSSVLFFFIEIRDRRLRYPDIEQQVRADRSHSDLYTRDRYGYRSFYVALHRVYTGM